MKYTPEIHKEICEGIAQGITLAEICRRPGMPDYYTVMKWQSGVIDYVPKEFVTDIARAREAGYDVIASNLRDTARGKGESTHDVQRDKLIVDTDLKLLAKWSKRYADRVTHGGDEENPIKHDMTISPAEAYRAMLNADS